MPTGSARRRGEGTRAAALVLGLLLTAGGCSLPFDEDPPSHPLAKPADPQVEFRALLRDRARAIRRGDRAAFLRGVDEARPKLVARQRRYFANLQELPLQRFEYAVPDGGLTTLPDGRVQSVVQLQVQLDRYDRVPVLTPWLYTFRQRDDGRWVLSGVRDREFETNNDIEPQPWDLLRIEVEQGDGVLGIFDRDSVDAADEILRTVEEGIDSVVEEVPLRWSRRVVVYALSDIRVLAGLDDLPGGDPERLDGVAFPVRAAPGSRELAGHRFMLHPRMIYRDDAARDRLIRHELTHVALARRDDRVPTWLSEGIAEYVSVQLIPPEERMISRDAVRAADRGIGDLPRDRDFNGPHSGANYGISWYACAYIADTFGEETLWRVFDAMRAGNGTTEREQDAVLRAQIGMDSRELARLAGQRIRDTFS
jgi:hypothetical protein